MPAPGDQHSRVSNPFDDIKPRVSEYTAQEIAILQSRLERQLGPEYLSARSGPSGQKVHYVAAEKVIGLANEVFGFNGWSSSIQNIQVDFVDEHPQTLKISLGLHVVVRVTLRDGTFHEDIGYGHIENCKGKAMAFEKAKKEGTTDALKRALRNFGNVLGNCVYDKEYLAKVTKLKVEPSRFDETNLHRHPGFSKKENVAIPRQGTVKQELPSVVPAPPHPHLPPLPDSFDDLLGDFDEADFCVVDADSHPDEVVAVETSQSTSGRDSVEEGMQAAGPVQPTISKPAQQGSVHASTRPTCPSTSMVRPQLQTPNRQEKRGDSLSGRPSNQAHCGPQTRPQSHQLRSSSGGDPNQRSSNNNSPHQMTIQANNSLTTGSAGAEPVAFWSARTVPRLPEDMTSAAPPGTEAQAALFNPKAESPSIRKTPGIDHNSSRPLSRTGQHLPPAKVDQEDGGLASEKNAASSTNSPQGQHRIQQQQHNHQRGSMLNPQFDQSRRIGAPSGAASPLSNRNQYKPPTMKRPPLADVSNGTTSGSGDTKRAKLG